MEKGEADRISALQDSLILDILSHLPTTKDTIRTGTLSKRWANLWTMVPTLIFTYSDLPLTQALENCNSRSVYALLVDKTLTQCRQLKLKKFKVKVIYDIRFESQFRNWIRYAINCNVEELNLEFWYTGSETGFRLDQIFFINSCFTDLRLVGCMLNPTGAISWKNLRSLCISYESLDEDLIKNILSGSPVLETLELDVCYGYRWLNIISKSVKNLVLSGYISSNDKFESDIIEINAPNILSLIIQLGISLSRHLLLNVSSLVEANLNYTATKNEHHQTTPNELEAEMLKAFIMNLRHVKELNIGFFCSKAFSCLQAKGFIFPSNVKFHGVCFENGYLGGAPSGDSRISMGLGHTKSSDLRNLFFPKFNPNSI